MTSVVLVFILMSKRTQKLNTKENVNLNFREFVLITPAENLNIS